jgi:hypothetical protein
MACPQYRGAPDGVKKHGGRRSQVSDFGWGLVLLGGYVLLVVLARWIYIARTNVIWTGAQADALTKRLCHQVAGDSSGNGQAEITKSTVRRLLREIKKENPTSKHTGIIGWNGSHQIAQWVLMHEAGAGAAERAAPGTAGGVGGRDPQPARRQGHGGHRTAEPGLPRLSR